MTRCKVGDLAVVNKSISHSWAIGTFVTVVERAEDFMGRANWVVDPPIDGFISKVLDRCLTPIQNPEEDAQDETLSWKKVPAPKEVA